MRGASRAAFQVASDVDEHVLRCEAEIAQSAHAATDPLGDVGEASDELAQGGIGVERSCVDGIDPGALVDRAGAAVRGYTERDGALGDSVGELAPRVDQLVEVFVQRLNVKLDGSWYFAERDLLLDWSETRTMTATMS